MSYARRLAQGRLDIVGTELKARQEGRAPAETRELIARLPDILAEGGRGPGRPRPPQDLEPPALAVELTAELDELVNAAQLGSLKDQSIDELSALADRLFAWERRVSEQRHRVHDLIDALQAEMKVRYQSGGASVEDLLGDR
ncbi:MAG: hypothetical protein JJLCMIEE_00554 [Acidimicrobiales bacterium]|nr:MAG: aerial mycelium formation protein [Actinomycetota bacterium]MBV6507505.1 hypothetical protein [Acidimicrobiales bacterium]RIK07881.1 MAG: aerial mycelium formation protein [Acidobacteriota bacterium]